MSLARCSATAGATRTVDNVGRRARFEQVVLPHVSAAYNLARWLMHDQHAAEDMVQDACLRAHEHLDGFRGDDGRAWFLTIVRNACRTALRQKQGRGPSVTIDPATDAPSPATGAPDAAALRDEDCGQLQRALAELPEDFREVVVLRELDGLSYKEIAAIVGVPLGTVMSRLARGRERLEQCLSSDADPET